MSSGEHDTLSPRSFAIDERTRGEILRSVLLTFIALTATIGLIAIAVRSFDRATIALGGCAVYVLLLWALRRWGPLPAAYATTLWYFVLASAAMRAGQGVNDVSLVLFPAGIVMAALLLERRHLIPLLVATTAAVAVLGFLDVREHGYKDPIDVVVVSVLLLISGVLTLLVRRSLESMAAEQRRARSSEMRTRFALEHQFSHDQLTSLPNRLSLHTRFLRPAGAVAVSGEERVGLAVIDVDRFREINEALGHSVGDELLLHIANRLDEGREGRRSQVFRLGGDEFAVALYGIDDPAEAEERARRLHRALKEPIEVAGIAIGLDASVGLAVYPDHGQDSHEILRCADVAMYHAKVKGRGVMTYASELDRHTRERLGLTADLARAVRQGDLQLHYQPKVALENGAVVGFEALVRWPHPELGLLGPTEFIPLAEATDIINPLTWWVVDHALAQLHAWHERFPKMTMAVNLSARNLQHRECASRLEESVRKSQVDPALVEFELTETAVMTDPETTLEVLKRINAIGAHLEIDDFGTGYSSLAYLKRFPLHGIKIDRSFVTDLATGEQNQAIVRSTVQLARSLGLNVVAEGIEDRETAEALRTIGCDLAQGYYFAHPAMPDQIDLLLSNRVALP